MDSNHCKVEFENDQVRVLRIKYGPKEKSVMHGHPDGVVVLLTDCHGSFTLPDGRTEPVQGKAGQVWWADSTEHLPENLGDDPLEIILVEMKS